MLKNRQIYKKIFSCAIISFFFQYFIDFYQRKKDRFQKGTVLNRDVFSKKIILLIISC